MNATLRKADGQIIIERVSPILGPSGHGQLILAGRPEEHPDIKSIATYILEADDGRKAEVRVTNTRHTLMVTSHYTEVDFKLIKDFA